MGMMRISWLTYVNCWRQAVSELAILVLTLLVDNPSFTQPRGSLLTSVAMTTILDTASAI